MRKLFPAVLAAGLALAVQAQAQVVHIGPAASPIAQAVAVPAGADTLYVSGITPSPTNADAKGAAPEFGDTKAQTLSILKKIEDILKAQGFGFGDVAMMRVYLVGDPAKGGKLDFAGMMLGYGQFFGTAEQPKLPSRSAMQVAALANPGFLVEIEVTAVRP